MPPDTVGHSQEVDWIARGAAGDREALRAIVTGHQDAVFRFLYKLSADRELARDLAQETFIRAFGGLKGFRAGAALRPWLFKIANNLFLDQMRKRPTESLDAAREDQALVEPGAEDPAIASLAAGLDLERALTLLPVNWRQAVILRHIEDLPYEEISEVLGVPVGTTKTWLFRGRERLRDLLEAGEGARQGGTRS